MKIKHDITLRKQAKQQRALATVGALIEAGTSILTHQGSAGFTANKVAEKAGVNIASFYQYFPNKKALLFQIAKVTWERQLARLSPILSRPGLDHARKLREFLREFFLIEAAEADLRLALRTASIDLRETEEFEALIAAGAELMRAFLKDAVKTQSPDELEFNVNFIVLLTTSFAERTTDQRASGANLVRQADLLTDMLVSHFRID